MLHTCLCQCLLISGNVSLRLIKYWIILVHLNVSYLEKCSNPVSVILICIQKTSELFMFQQITHKYHKGPQLHVKELVHWPKDSLALKYILNNIISEHPCKSPESSKNHMNKSFIKLILNSRHRNVEMERSSCSISIFCTQEDSNALKPFPENICKSCF